MRLKSNQDERGFRFIGDFSRPSEHFLMAEVNAIEVANGEDGVFWRLEKAGQAREDLHREMEV